MSSSQARERPPSLLACGACRKKHLRCDAKMPVCSRCERRSLECTYVESKRGYKGPKKCQSAKETLTESEKTNPKADDKLDGTLPYGFSQQQTAPGLDLSIASDV